MIEWTVEKRKLSELKELPNNPRKISKEAFDALKKRLRERGFHDILKIDKDNFVLSGNQRFKAMMEEWGGDYEVDVKVPSEKLSESDRKKIILESNHNDGEYDLDILAEEFEKELEGLGMDEMALQVESLKMTQELGSEREEFESFKSAGGTSNREMVFFVFDNLDDKRYIMDYFGSTKNAIGGMRLLDLIRKHEDYGKD